MSEWQFKDYQASNGETCFSILNKHALVYLGFEERTGKTGTAIYIANKTKAKFVLIVTKAAVTSDWLKQLGKFDTRFEFHVTSYHSAHKFKGAADLVILDEAHNYISSSPKPGAIWKQIYRLVYGLPLIYLSATPHPQGYQMLYHQFKLSMWSPWATYKTFYDWYREYAARDGKGETEKIFIAGRMIETYKSLQDKRVKSCVDHLFVTLTRKQLGFKHEPTDEVHYIELSEGCKKACSILQKDKLLRFKTAKQVSRVYIADSPIALRVALHQLEGGTLITKSTKGIKQKNLLKERKKIDFILAKFGDSKDLAIMYQFKQEETKLKEVFKKAQILQATRNAEGVDLHEVRHLVIYSQDYSAGKHSQRRARQANMNREHEIIVHHLLVKGGLSEQVYNTVCLNKKNFIDSRFDESLLEY